MAFIIDKDQQQNLQQVVAPAAPANAPASSAEPLTQSQFVTLLGIIKSYPATNTFVAQWKNYAFDVNVQAFEALRQHIRDKFNAIISASMFANPLDIAKGIAAAIHITDKTDSKLQDAVLGDFVGDDAEQKRIEAYALAGTSQGFEGQIDTVLDASRTFPSITEEFRTRLLTQATTKLAATGIDATKNPHAIEFLAKFDASVFGLQPFGWSNIGAAMNGADIWLPGFAGTSIDQDKWAKWVDDQVATIGSQAVDKLLLKTKLEVAHDDIATLGTVQSIDFDTLTKLMALRNPTVADVNGLFNINGGESLTAILTKYGVNNNLRVVMTSSTQDARNKTLHLTITYLNDPTSVGVPFTLFNGDIAAKLTIPLVQQAREALAKIVGSIQVSKQTLHEKDLLDAGLFGSLSNEERIRKINANFNEWQEVSADQFKILTGFDLTTLDKSSLDFKSDGKFDFKVFVRKVNGRLEYTTVLVGGTIPANQNTPTTAVAGNAIQPEALKTGNAFVSYQDIIRGIISSYSAGYKNNVWLEQLLDANGQFIARASDDFISKFTNAEDLKNAIVRALQEAGASSTEMSRWTFSNPTLTVKASEQNSGKYTLEVSVADTILATSSLMAREINPPRAFVSHTFTVGTKTINFYSVFDPAHRTDVSTDVSLIEAPDKAPFDNPESFTGDIPYDQLIWKGLTFKDLIDSLRTRGIIFEDVAAKFVDITQTPIKPTFSYRLNPEEPRIGGIFTFKITYTNAANPSLSETKTVSIFVVLESKPATQAEKEAAKKEVQETADQANDAINLALNYGQKIENVDQLRLKITEIVNKFNQDVDSSSTITEPKLHTLKMNAEAQIMEIVKDLITSIDLDALIAKLAPMLYPLLGKDDAIATLIRDPHLMEIIRKYPGVIQKLINIKPPLSKDVLEFILKNKNLLDMFSNFIEHSSENVINKVVNGLTTASRDYKYGYFGAGAALGLAGLGGAAATVGTVRAAKKAKKVTTHKIKIRSNKLISFITGGISLLAMGGSAALLILFFMKQGGF